MSFGVHAYFYIIGAQSSTSDHDLPGKESRSETSEDSASSGSASTVRLTLGVCITL